MRKIYRGLLGVLLGATLWLDFNVNAAGLPEQLCDRAETLKLAAQVSTGSYPDADTVLINDFEYHRYNPDGTSEKVDDVYEKVLTEKGRRERTTLDFHFTIPYETVGIDMAEIIRPDGTTLPIDIAANSKESIESAQMQSNIYNPNSKMVVLQLPGLQLGDVIHYRWREKVIKTRMPDMWCGFFLLQSTSPQLRYRIVIDAPESRPLKKILIKDEVKGTVTFNEKRADGRIIYDWNVGKVDRIFEEPEMPEMHTVVQRLLVSTVPDWRDISSWYWRLCLPHLEKVTPAMKEQVKELTAGISDPDKQIEAIFSFVSNKIRYMGITTEKEAPGYEPHDVNITFDNKYGVCRDKAALLVAMLRIAGFKAYPVIFHSGAKKDQEVPNNYFNHAIVSVETAPGKYKLMDPTDETTKDIFPSYLCNMSYLAATPEGETLLTSGVIPADKNLMRISTEGKIGADGSFNAVTEMVFDGVNDGVYRGAFMNWPEDKRYNFFSGRIKDIIPGGRLKSVEIFPRDLTDMREPLKVVMSYSAEKFPIVSDNYMMFRLPWVGADFGMVNFVIGNAGLEKRLFPMKLFSTCGAVEKFKLIIEGAGKEIALPDFKKIDTKDMEWAQSLTFNEGVLQGEGKFLVKTMEFSPAEYLQLKQNLKDIEYAKRKMPIMATKIAASSDSVVLDTRTDVRLNKNGDSVTTTYVKQKVLNYAGKKKFSELKFDYNPYWSEIKVVSAQVTDGTGVIRKLGKDELNIMDAGWVGDAPRYPAEKLLVLSLPGVGKDSIIEYAVEMKRKARPFFSTIAQFQLEEPLNAKTVTLTLPEEVAGSIKSTCNEFVTYSRSDKAGETTFSWKARNQDKVQNERSTPPLWSFCPTIFISNGNWGTYGQYWLKGLLNAADQSQKCRQLAADLIRNVPDKLEQVRRIRDYHAKHIVTAGPAFDRLPAELLTPADKTMADGYGHSADRAIVLYAMLESAGFKPEFVFGVEYPDVPELLNKIIGYPQQFIFSGVMVRVKLNNEWLYLNGSTQYAEPGVFGHNGYPVFVLSSGTFEPARSSARLENRLAVNVSIRLDENGNADINRKVEYYGVEHARFNQSYSEMTPEKRRRFLQQETADIAQSAVMTKVNIDSAVYPGINQITVNVPGYAVRDKKYLYFSLPSGVLRELIHIDNEKRQNPYLTTSRTQCQVDFDVELPAKCRNFVMLPTGFDWRSPVNDGRITYRVERKSPTRLHFVLQADLKPGFYRQDKFADLVYINERLSKPETWLILMEME